MPSITLNVSSGGNDGMVVNNGAFDGTGIYLDFGKPDFGGGQQNRDIFCLFSGVTIPPASVILNAYLTLVNASGSGGTTGLISLENSDNPSAPTTAVDFEGRTRTTGVSWSPGTTTTGVSYNSPDIKADVQTVVSRAGWASGNNMLVIVDNNTSTDTVFRAASYENTSYTEPRLTIEYFTPGGEPVSMAPYWMFLKRYKWLYNKLIQQGAVPLGRRDLLPI